MHFQLKKYFCKSTCIALSNTHLLLVVQKQILKIDAALTIKIMSWIKIELGVDRCSLNLFGNVVGSMFAKNLNLFYLK
jgi:hypothetical protein